jgi:predicted MFS family arabinose efflux permease
MSQPGIAPHQDAPGQKASQRTRLTWSSYQVLLVIVLLMIAVSNYLDRGILAVVQEPIKRELGLSDWQLGLLGGPAFALFYAFAGLPVARLAERVNRAGLLATCVGIWSAMTALCGTAHNFIQLAVCRFGVGAGEGGSLPISHSLVSDNFNVRQRGFVLSILSSAPSIANVLTPIIGAIVAQRFGWRVAFFAVGLPGILIALAAWLVIRDRRSEVATAARPKSNFIVDVRWLVRNRAFVFVFIGGAFTGMGVYGISLFEISFLIRSHDLTLAQAGTVRSVLGIAGLVGTVIGGLAADRFADDRGRSYVVVPAIGSAVTCVLYFVAFSQSFWPVVLTFLVLAHIAYNTKNGPVFAAVQNIVPGHMRATGAAVYMIAATVLGSALGAPLTGAASDYFATQHFPVDLGDFALVCHGGRAVAGSTAAVAAGCEIAVAEGLRGALMLITVVFALASLCLFISARTIRINNPRDGSPT